MIVGEDWLEAVSPVWVDYLTKPMRSTYQGNLTDLQGVRDQLSGCPQLSSNLLGLIRAGGVSCCLQWSSAPATAVLFDDQQLSVLFRLIQRRCSILMFSNCCLNSITYLLHQLRYHLDVLLTIRSLLCLLLNWFKFAHIIIHRFKKMRLKLSYRRCCRMELSGRVPPPKCCYAEA
jgi:hypothetical protein